MLEMDARNGCSKWMLEMDARNGCSNWMLEMDARNGFPTSPQNVTMKASSDVPRMSEHWPLRGKMRLNCLGCPTHQPIKLLTQKLPSNVGAFPVSY